MNYAMCGSVRRIIHLKMRVAKIYRLMRNLFDLCYLLVCSRLNCSMVCKHCTVILSAHRCQLDLYLRFQHHTLHTTKNAKTVLIALVWYLATLRKLTKCVLTMIACVNESYWWAWWACKLLQLLCLVAYAQLEAYGNCSFEN